GKATAAVRERVHAMRAERGKLAEARMVGRVQSEARCQARERRTIRPHVTARAPRISNSSPSTSTRSTAPSRGSPAGRDPDPDPPPGDWLTQREPLLSLPDLHRLTAGLSGSERQDLFAWLPAEVQDALSATLWAALESERSL